MMKIVKTPAPDFLRKNYKKWGKRYKAKRNNPAKSNAFTWAIHKGTKANILLLPFLRIETNHHCSFCDGFPLETTGETIEHFRPKSVFPLISYVWANLFHCCKYCNESKGENPGRNLLKPDKLSYSFGNILCLIMNREISKPILRFIEMTNFGRKIQFLFTV